MNTRGRRFFAAFTQAQPKTKETLASDERSNLTGWQFRTCIHPIDGYKMALADRGMTLHGEHDPTNSSVRYEGNLILTAVRLANSTEVSAGIGIWVYGTQADARHSILDNQNMTGFVYCYETAPAYLNTAQLRVAWSLADGTAKPDVSVFRGIPRVLHISETAIFLHEQMTARWASGEADNPAHESAISGRTAAMATGDKIAFGIPWIHHEHEVIAEADISKLAHAVAKIKALVAPPPAPPADSEG